jgi:hypothetical protein
LTGYVVASAIAEEGLVGEHRLNVNLCPEVHNENWLSSMPEPEPQNAVVFIVIDGPPPKLDVVRLASLTKLDSKSDSKSSQHAEIANERGQGPNGESIA